jgi:hypothetical protein
VRLLAPREPDEHLDAAVLEIHLQRHQRQTLFCRSSNQFPNLVPVQEEFALPHLGVVRVAAVTVRADVHVQHPRFSTLDPRVAVAQVHAPFANRLDLGAEQGEARLVGLEDVVVVARLAIVGNDPLLLLALALVGHGSTTILRSSPSPSSLDPSPDTFVTRRRLVPSTLTPLAGAVGVGVIAFTARYALTGAIENDHFVTFTRALQVLYGDLPVRDFDDPGFPLSYLISTAAAALFGPSLLVNVLLCVVLLALTSSLTYLLAVRATASPVAGALAAACTIVVVPRLYNSTKVIVPVVAIWLAWRYADSPRPGRLFALATWSAVAFLLRHDYLAYVGVGNLALLASCHAHLPREAVQRFCVYLALMLLLISPWLLYVQAYEGIPTYFASAVRFTAAEGRRTATGPLPAAFFALVAIPVAALIASFRHGPHVTRGQLASAALMLISLDLVFLRDVLVTRIPDVVAPTAVVGAALAGHLLPAHAMNRASGFAAAMALVAVTLAIATTRPSMPPALNPADRLVQITKRLRDVSPQVTPNPSLTPLIDYLTRCTRPDERILVAGFGPEIPALAHRPFAARLPTWIPGYYEDPADVNRALLELRRERLGAAVFLDGTPVVSRSWPPLLQAIRDRGFDEYPVVPVNARLRVWLPHQAATTSRDIATDLPCPVR